MIRTATQYGEAKEFIDKDPEFYDYVLSDKMNSYEYNLYLQDTQYYFNVLYEKLRELEDIIEYLEWYSKKKISAARANIASKEGYLESVTKLSSAEKKISKRIGFDNSFGEITDRDGVPLRSALITRSGAATSGYLETSRRKILGASKKASRLCDSDTLAGFARSGSYVSTYSLEDSGKIEEILEVELDDAKDFNRVDYEPINCEIEYLGRNENNRIELKLSTDKLSKTKKMFNRAPYNGSALDNIGAMDFAAKPSSVSDNVSALNAKLDDMNNVEFYSEAEIYQDLVEENERKDSFSLACNN